MTKCGGRGVHYDDVDDGGVGFFDAAPVSTNPSSRFNSLEIRASSMESPPFSPVHRGCVVVSDCKVYGVVRSKGVLILNDAPFFITIVMVRIKGWMPFLIFVRSQEFIKLFGSGS